MESDSEEEVRKCEKHKKPADVVCLECRIRICAQCALFGEHNSHIVKPEEDILEEISSRAQDLLVTFEKVEEKYSFLKK